MGGDHINIHCWLLPLSWLYGIGVRIRNLMFDWGILPTKRFDLPVICVGNLTVGGTGKTPHTEYLIRLLAKDHQVAVLSRGYKRKSKGYLLASDQTKMSELGDEPYQMKQKFPFIHMAVDKDRCHGIEQLTKENVCPKTEVVILDDAFQHRHVAAGLNLLLMDYHRLIYFDELLPAGRLREPVQGKRRADAVIVTKCPPSIMEKECEDIVKSLHMENGQQVFFTTYRYPDHLENVGVNPLLVTGIASPQQMIFDLKKIIPEFEVMSFPDHYNFTPQDMEKIQQRAAGRTILTTEKDATRLHGLKNQVVIPIEVAFIDGKQREFDTMIQRFVNKQ